MLLLSNLGHIRGRFLIGSSWASIGNVAPVVFSLPNAGGEREEARTFLLGPFSCLNHNHCPLLQPPAHFSSLWYEWRLLEDAIVWRVDQKKGGKMRRNQPSIFLSAVPPFTPSCSPSLSLPLRLLSISVRLPHSLLYPIFSQGWTCVMALLSPQCHLARPI